MAMDDTGMDDDPLSAQPGTSRNVAGMRASQYYLQDLLSRGARNAEVVG